MLYSLDWLRVGEEFPPASEVTRLERYRDNRQLWKGNHTDVYGDWWRVLREEYGVSHEIVFNFHARISTLFADLTFGDAPTIVADTEEGQLSVDTISERSAMSTVGYEAALDLSRYGDALLKLRLRDGEAEIRAQSPAIWFPVVSRDDIRSVRYHVLAWVFEDGESRYLRAEIHSEGLIENRLFALKGTTIQDEVPLTRFFPDREAEEETGLDDFMVIHVPGLRASDEFYGKDDYSDIDSLVLERMGRAGQISRIQDKHSDPNMYGPEDLMRVDPITGAPQLDSGGRYYPVPEGEAPPGYLTWDASQTAQFEFMDRLKQDLYEISETTPTAFGDSSTGYAESGTSLRLRMVPPLAKARRNTRRFEPNIKSALILAAKLEGGEPPETINISWKDGLPVDPREAADIEAARLSSGNTSVYSSIQRLDGGTREEIETELEQIREETSLQSPANSSRSRIDSILNGSADDSREGR